jgi:hypothetical protein
LGDISRDSAKRTDGRKSTGIQENDASSAPASESSESRSPEYEVKGEEVTVDGEASRAWALRLDLVFDLALTVARARVVGCAMASLAADARRADWRIGRRRGVRGDAATGRNASDVVTAGLTVAPADAGQDMIAAFVSEREVGHGLPFSSTQVPCFAW